MPRSRLMQITMRVAQQSFRPFVTRLREEHVTAPVLLLGKTIRLLPNNDGELRAADGDQPADPVGMERYLAKAFGEHLADVRTAITAMEELASRYPIVLTSDGAERAMDRAPVVAKAHRPPMLLR